VWNRIFFHALILLDSLHLSPPHKHSHRPLTHNAQLTEPHTDMRTDTRALTELSQVQFHTDLSQHTTLTHNSHALLSVTTLWTPSLSGGHLSVHCLLAQPIVVTALSCQPIVVTALSPAVTTVRQVTSAIVCHHSVAVSRSPPCHMSLSVQSVTALPSLDLSDCHRMSCHHCLSVTTVCAPPTGRPATGDLEIEFIAILSSFGGANHSTKTEQIDNLR
jgi:hypothetical protein